MQRVILCLLFLFFSAPYAVFADDAVTLAVQKDWAGAKSAAQSTGNSAAVTLIDWMYVLDGDSGASFDEISIFLQTHPYWPDAKKIQLRAERAMRDANASDSDMLAWFERFAPISGVGKWSYAEALKRSGNTDKIPQLIKDAWKDGDFNESEEAQFVNNFGSLLTLDDYRARIDRLLWEEKTKPAQRIIEHLPVNEQVVAQARIALIREEKTAPFLVKQALATNVKSQGLLYERIRYQVKKKDTNAARDLLLQAPADVSHPDLWWKIRGVEIRRAVDEGHFTMASKLLANHGQKEGRSFSEALWLKGWIELQFMNEPKAAYQSFYHMYDAVSYPVSRARAAYWMARAAKKSGDTQTAEEWFNTAARHPTTFYGQLAFAEVAPDSDLKLPDEPALGFFESNNELPEDLKSAIAYLIQADQSSLASRIINHVIESSTNDNTVLQVANLGHTLNAPHISVKAAKKAQMKNVVLKNVGYPLPETDKSLPIERALTLAIIRQESEFDPRAVSPSNALGLMQLLPGTAKETAKKIDVAYEGKEQLYDPTYNMMLGSNYLSRMINAYDGSYVMAIAAYNGGPGNVNKWRNQFGEPGSELYGVIDWIEKIPFMETRNYVQRVMENMQVYRALEGGSARFIAEDLTK